MNDKADIRVRDPVCGRQLLLAEAAATLDHHGWAHFFSSAACRDAFQANPEAFAERRPPRRPARSGTVASPARWADLLNLTFKPKENEQ